MGTGLGQLLHCVPVTAPINSGPGDDIKSEMIDASEFTDLEFHVMIGTLASSGNSWYIEPYGSSTTTAAGAGVPFFYRISATAVGGDDLGDVTTASSTEYVTLTSDNSSMLLIIKIDPADVEETASDKRYVYINIDAATDDNTSSQFSIEFIGLPRHKMAEMRSSTV